MADEQLELGDDERSIALKRAWARALQVLAAKVNKASFESWIRPIRPVAYEITSESRQATLGVASPFARDWLKRYAADIQNALEEQLGSPLDIRFTLLTSEPRPLFGEGSSESVPPESTPSTTPTLPNPDPNPVVPKATTHHAPSYPAGSAAAASASAIPAIPLNEKFTFETFIIGKSNRLAQAGAMQVAMSPGLVYNPLFLYGNSGLGKTHLLHAIGNAALRLNGSLRVAMVDGENFTEHYVSSLRDRKVEDFRRFYRSIDIWLVDDIQFIASKEQTKEEFFHTFNTLYQTGKQIVISSDRSPRELRTMDERIRSRFESGLIADINAPELETRAAILERRCQAEDWKVPKDVLFYIASAIQSNIRALQGALTRLVAYTSVMNSPYSIEAAQSVLGQYFIEKPPPGYATNKSVSVEFILQTVAEEFGISVDALRGERRDKEVVKARQAAMYLCRELGGINLAQIGAAIGGRDHTTVQRAIVKLENMMPFDRPLYAIVQEARRKLEQ